MYHFASHYNTLQHTATHCNTLQQATAFFKSEAAMSVDSGSRCAPVEGSYRTHLCDVLSAQLLVTRVDVALAHDSAGTVLCCSVLQCVAVCCSVLLSAAV